MHDIVSRSWIFKSDSEQQGTTDENKTITRKTTMRPYVIEETSRRVIAFRTVNGREVHIPARDVAAVLKQLEYEVFDERSDKA